CHCFLPRVGSQIATLNDHEENGQNRRAGTGRASYLIHIVLGAAPPLPTHKKLAMRCIIVIPSPKRPVRPIQKQRFPANCFNMVIYEYHVKKSLVSFPRKLL